VVKKEIKLSEDEKLQLAKKEMVAESAEVLSAAVDSDNDMNTKVDKDSEAAKSAFEIAGMAEPEGGKP